MCCLVFIIIVWMIIGSEDWNCTENWEATFYEPPPDENECNAVENWMGTIDTYSFLVFFGIGCRMAIVIVFLWALCRINRLVAQL